MVWKRSLIANGGLSSWATSYIQYRYASWLHTFPQRPRWQILHFMQRIARVSWQKSLPVCGQRLTSHPGKLQLGVQKGAQAIGLETYHASPSGGHGSRSRA